MKFSEWKNKKNTDDSFEILEQIFLDIEKLYILENDMEEEEEDLSPAELESPFSDDDSAAPVQDFSSEVEEEEKKEKEGVKRLLRDTRESMINLRYKAMMIRGSRIRKIKKLGPNDLKTKKILEKLGYRSDLAGFQSAIGEEGNDVPNSKIMLLRNKTLNELEVELMNNLAPLYEIYSNRDEKFYTNRGQQDKYEFLYPLIMKLRDTLTRRLVVSNKARPWSSPAPLVDKRLSAVMRSIGTIIKSIRTDNYRSDARKEKKEKLSSSFSTNNGDDSDLQGSQALRNASTNFSSTGRQIASEPSEDQSEIMSAVRSSFDSLTSKNKKDVITFLLSFGLDDIAKDFHLTGSINLPQNLEISILHKVNKSGKVSDKIIDDEAIIEKLKDFGIMATKPQVRSGRFNIINFLRDAIQSKLGSKLESLSFSKWLLINEII